MTIRSKKGTIAFQPRARILKLIGEELISDEIVAISELVKNSHDADATKVTLRFSGVTALGGQIEVIDDGSGMDLDTLLGRWMEPAASTKVGEGRQVTRRGRRVLGEKGVGRFAADKIARILEIFTRCPRQPEEIRASVDWDRFDTDELMLGDIKNHWEVRPAEVVRSHGTLLRLSDLRSTWSERMFRRLSMRLSRLLSPFQHIDRFGIQIESDEFPEYSGELRADFLKKAPYRIEAEFDGLQTISISLNGRRAAHQNWNGQGELSCGPVRIRLFAFDLEGESLAKIGPRMEIRAWLREWTGVNIYRDGFRVWPYGEPHDDWLRLDQRRVNNPVEHLSNNQVIGFIEIGRDRNPDLMDQTNREGLMHNKAFEDLRRLVYFVFQVIETERQSIRHPDRSASGAVRSMAAGTNAISERLAQIAPRLDKELGQALRQIKNDLDEQVRHDAQQMTQMLEGCLSLASIGQMVSGILPVTMTQFDELQLELGYIREFIEELGISRAKEAVAHLNRGIETIKGHHRMMLAVSGNRERRRAIDVEAEVQTFREFIAPILKEQEVRLEIGEPDGQVLRTEMRPENFLCVLQILAMNSLESLRRTGEPRIRISVSGDDEFVEIFFSDNGPGISPEAAQSIFEPRFTRKEGGRGMGLTIARRLVQAHLGSIDLVMDGRRRGAHFRILLPRKKSRATIYGCG